MPVTIEEFNASQKRFVDVGVLGLAGADVANKALTKLLDAHAARIQQDLRAKDDIRRQLLES